MTTTYGLTPQGLVIKSLNVIRADLDAAMRAAFGQSLTLGDSSVLGIIDGIMAERYAELWALAQAVYNSQDPDSATGQALDALSKLTGTLRPQATFSSVTETLVGSPTSTVLTGTVIKTESTGLPFATTQDAVIVLLASWVATHAYIAGDRVTNAGNSYQCTISGVSAGSGGPTSATNPVPADGSVTWFFLGASNGAVDVPMLAQTSGQVVAVAGDLSQIATPAAGLVAVVNLLDATQGQPLASDATLRTLRDAELSGDGAGTAAAIQAQLLQVEGVTSVTVFHNDGDAIDANGLPPHSVEALVLGGADADIAQVLYDQISAGIATVGASSFTITDSQGFPHVISFERPTPVLIYVALSLTFDPDQYPSDGNAEVQLAIATAGQTYPTGLSVFAAKVASAAFGVPGVLDVEPVSVFTDVIGTPTAWAPSTTYSATVGSRSVVSTADGRLYICVTSGASASSGPGPSGTGTAITDGTAAWYFLGSTIPISSFKIASFDTSRIIVSSTPA